MTMKTIVVAGSGVLGSQIAFQSAFHGCAVTVYDVAQGQLDRLGGVFDRLAEAYVHDLGASADALAAARGRITATTVLGDAVRGAELVIEAVPEHMGLKEAFYRELAGVAPADTIFATNSSTFRPSDLAGFTGRPARFIALHFANQIWRHNTAEVMGHPGTDPAVFAATLAFATSIGMVALPLHKEQPGYILNTLLVPLLSSAMHLAANDIAAPETIDKTWMIATGSPTGPFAALDVIGMRTAHMIAAGHAAAGDANSARVAAWLKAHFLDTGRLGMEAGQGVYSYPNPRYRDPDFLKG